MDHRERDRKVRGQYGGRGQDSVGEIIAVDGKTYLKSALTGPFYQESAVGAGLFQPSLVRDIVDTIGDLLLKPGVDLVKGADVACGSKQCYTVSAELTAADLEGAAAGAIDTLPVNLAGATLKVTIRVEKDAPSHIASLTAILSQADGSVLTVDITASKWDEPVTISAPPSDQVKPAS